MRRGRFAAGIAATGVGLAGLAVASSLAIALSGPYLLMVAPLLGLPITFGVFKALRRVCTTGSRKAEAQAVAGILALPVLAVFGISFGGFQLLPPAILLAVAAALTPRPRLS
jgi:hypothetical protein